MKRLKKIRVVSIMRGVSKKSGVPYTRLVLKGIRDDGTSVVETFFVSEEVYQQMVKENIQEDCYISLELSFDDNFRSTITDIFLEEEN